MKEKGKDTQHDKTLQSLHTILLCMEDSLFGLKGERLYWYILETVEKILIEDILLKTEGNQIRASKMLGINRNTLRAKLKRLGIMKDDYR